MRSISVEDFDLLAGQLRAAVRQVAAAQSELASPTFSTLAITNLAAVGDLSVGGGVIVKAITSGTISGVNPGSIAAQTRGSVDATLTGVAAGDIVVLIPPDGLNTGLVYAGCRVTAANTVRIYLGNITAGPIDDGALDWLYLWLDIT